MYRRRDVLHRIVDRQAGRDAPSRGVYVEFNRTLGIFRFEKQELSCEQCRGLVGYLDASLVHADTRRQAIRDRPRRDVPVRER